MLGRGLESLIPPNQSSPREHGTGQAPNKGSSSEHGLEHAPNHLEHIQQNSDDLNFKDQRAQDFSNDTAVPNFDNGNLRRPQPPEVPKRSVSKIDLEKKPQALQVKASKKETSIISPIFQIELAKIKPNPEQPRHIFDKDALLDLANSIREYGILQPLLVSKIERDTEAGQDVEYQLIVGERRLRAAELAGMTQVPVVIRGPISRKEQLELAIIENLQREDLNPIEAARAFARLQDEFRLTQREISSRIGKSRETIANTLRLLSLPSSVLLALENGKLSESQGRMLLMVSNPGEQEKLFNDILNNHLSVRELRRKIKNISKTTGTESSPEEAELLDDYDDPEVADLKEQLETFFGAPVTIKKQGTSGKIVIDFYSPEELRGIALKLARSVNSYELGEDYGEGFVV